MLSYLSEIRAHLQCQGQTVPPRDARNTNSAGELTTAVGDTPVLPSKSSAGQLTMTNVSHSIVDFARKLYTLTLQTQWSSLNTRIKGPF